MRTFLELVFRFGRFLFSGSLILPDYRHIRQTFESLFCSVEHFPLFCCHFFADLDVTIERLLDELPATGRTRVKFSLVGKSVGRGFEDSDRRVRFGQCRKNYVVAGKERKYG